MGTVVRLYHSEKVEFDDLRLNLLSTELGSVAGNRAVARAMEEIAIRLTRIESAFLKGELGRMAVGVRRLAGLSEEAGLTTLASMCRTVGELTERHDTEALAACLARLIRVGEMSLVTVWDVHDISV